MTIRIMGIDPGLKGAFVTITNELEIVGRTSMVPYQYGIPCADIVLNVVKAHDPDIIYVEKTLMPNALKFIYATGALVGILATTNIPIKTVTPAKWQNKLVKHLEGSDTKAKALQAALQHIPGATPDMFYTFQGRFLDGVADAVCVAVWGMKYDLEVNTNEYP